MANGAGCCHLLLGSAEWSVSFPLWLRRLRRALGALEHALTVSWDIQRHQITGKGP